MVAGVIAAFDQHGPDAEPACAALVIALERIAWRIWAASEDVIDNRDSIGNADPVVAIGVTGKCNRDRSRTGCEDVVYQVDGVADRQGSALV